MLCYTIPMKFTSSRRKGFTLVELLVVIAIIAILSGIIITSLTGAKSKSRDAQRISDLNQIQLALEQFFDRCGQYPPTPLATTAQCPASSSITFGSFISVIPVDPSSPHNSYGYAVNSLNTDYVLHATLENQNAAQNNSYPESNFSVDTGWQYPPPAQPNLGAFSYCFDGQNGATPTHPNDYCISTK